VSVGIATRETLVSGPPSTDITYVMPEAKAAICFAVPLDRDKIRAFLGKDLPNSRIDHEKDNVSAYLKAIKIAKRSADFLKNKGFNSIEIIPNFEYRTKVKGWRLTLPPNISLRYIAARSGVGSIGWSGNIGLKGYGATILLGGLVTSANLEPTDPIPPEESHCNECKLCTKVCAFRMFSENEKQAVKLGDLTFEFSKRLNIVRCYIVCGGRSGLDKTANWSTWSPHRHPYPETDREVYQTFAKAFDPYTAFYHKLDNREYVKSQIKHDKDLIEALAGKRYAAEAFEDLYLTCGNCQLICFGDPKQTKENYNLLINSGCSILNKDGTLEIVSPELAKKRSPLESLQDLNDRHKNFAKIVENYIKK